MRGYRQDIHLTRGCWKGIGTHPQFQVLDLVSIAMSNLSEDGFWEFVDGQWKPTEKQLQSLEQGARPYNSDPEMTNHVGRVTAIQAKPPTINTTEYQHKVQNSRFDTGKKKLIFGTGTLVLIVAMIIVVSTLSPGTIGLLDEIRDSDGDGITDYEELKAGTNPELRDSDYDNLNDDEDDCPSGQTNWNSKDPTLDLDGDGCLDEGEDIDDDNDGYLDVDDLCPRGEMNWDSVYTIFDIDSDGCRDETEDNDDDGDAIIDQTDDCPLSYLEGWESTSDTDHDGDGCRDSSEDDDDDNDNIKDTMDDCPKGSTGWNSKFSTDYDGDGCKDSSEDNDDDGDNVDDEDDECPKGSSGWASSPSTDYDGDGCRDSLEDTDDDNDGVTDNLDEFPLDTTEWSDFDGDGIGDNADSDDDNDGVSDLLDVNDYADTAFSLTLDELRVITQMDTWDSQAEVYICVYVNEENIGCAPSSTTQSYYWALDTGVNYLIDEEFFIDLPETIGSHEIMISVWDQDVFDDDRIDISPDNQVSSYIFNFDSTVESFDTTTLTVTGEGDGQGWDGELKFSFALQDIRLMRQSTFIWQYQSQEYSLTLTLNYEDYNSYKLLDHSTSGWDDYQRFSTPSTGYIIQLANTLSSMADNAGHTSSLEKAEFILAFVGAIPYQYDIDGMGVSDYPKYPIEMLWEYAGDCEDAAALYISLVEAVGYDAVLLLLLVKSDSDDDEWGGHAMPAIYIPGHSGNSVTPSSGEKAGTQFYFAEATGWYDGYSGIGENNWYDMDDIHIYDVE